MEEKLTEKVLNYLDKIENLAESQLPDFATQYIQFLLIDTYTYLFMIGVGLVGFFACCKLFKHGYDLQKEAKSYEESGIGCMVVGGVIGAVLLILCSVELPRKIGNLMKIKVAPKVYLLEHFRK